MNDKHRLYMRRRPDRPRLVALILIGAALAVLGWLSAFGPSVEAQKPFGIQFSDWGPGRADLAVRTFAGTGSWETGGGNNDGARLDAAFDIPTGIAFERDGSLLVADFNNHLVRKIGLDGEVSTLAGSGEAGWSDGPGKEAEFNGPAGLAVGPSGDVYVSDALNHVIRRVNPDGSVETLAGGGSEGSANGKPQELRGFSNGRGSEARFDAPAGIVVDQAGTIFVADKNNNRIRRITPAGDVTTFAGSGAIASVDGSGLGASFAFPTGLAIDGLGNLYVTEQDSASVRKVDPSGNVSTVLRMHDGPSGLSGLAVDHEGNLYVGDVWTNQIRFINRNGEHSTYAGVAGVGFSDGPGDTAQFVNPTGIVVAASGALFVADAGNHRIRVIE